MTQEFWDHKYETLPLREMKDLQSKRLKKLIKYVYTTNKYYHKKLTDVNITPCCGPKNFWPQNLRKKTF